MPYRSTTKPPKARALRDLSIGFAIVWLFAVVRVGLGLYLRQTFGAELTLALLAVVLIPAALRRE